jgi:hypothetical protein
MRYQAYYCGLCRTLKERYGDLGRLTLSNDMTFLLILLSSLYEPEEDVSKGLPAPPGQGAGGHPKRAERLLRRHEHRPGLP